jgi:hypothetical protein
MQQTKPLKIEAELMWAFLDTPNQMSGKYQVDLCNLSKSAIKALEDAGVKVRNKEDKGFFITAKSTKYPITAVDREGKPIEAKVGNGSKGVAIVNFYDHKFAKQYGLGVGINKLIVTDLIEYANADPIGDDVL